MLYTYYRGERTTKDPWDARTLEWSLPNPPPEYNFRVIPTVHARDHWWYAKRHPEEIAKENEEHAKAEDAHGGVHMPFQSIYPFLASFGVLIGAIGTAVVDPADPTQYPGFWGPKIAVTIVGGVIMIVSIFLWAIEGAEGYHMHLDHDGNPVDEAHAGYAKH
jgi:cytochrome c oxidase subunit 1